MKRSFHLPFYEGKITLILKQQKDIFPKRKPKINFAVTIKTKIFGRKIIEKNSVSHLNSNIQNSSVG